MLAGRRPLIMSRVSLNWYQKQSRLFRAVERRILHRTVDLVICNSAAIAQDLVAEGVPSAAIRLIPNGIDLAMFSAPEMQQGRARDRLGIAKDAMVFSLVANFHSYKGHADLLQALHRVRNRLPPQWMLLAPGRDVGGNFARIRRLCEDLGLCAHVRFLGELNDVAAVLAAADIHVSASHTEGFPNNILEAMCAGLPLVATAVGGVPEMVVDGVTALLVPACDPAAMGSALLALVDDPARRQTMGAAGRDRVVSHYAIERSVRALQDSYASVAAPGQSHAVAAVIR
jgi:glycosyltransferase involved in cell wall biosynthesis